MWLAAVALDVNRELEGAALVVSETLSSEVDVSNKDVSKELDIVLVDDSFAIRLSRSVVEAEGESSRADSAIELGSSLLA